MTEGLFLLTTLFVAYVVYVILSEKKSAETKATKPTVAVAHTEQQATIVAEKPIATAPKAKPAIAKKVAVMPTTSNKAVAPAEPEVVAVPETIKSTGLKDPKTGEIAKTYSNYRFTKRWIKEALVAEGLVEKVFKNEELNAEVEATIKTGIIKLEGMDKYKA
jgi:hypothetical protein